LERGNARDSAVPRDIGLEEEGVLRNLRISEDVCDERKKEEALPRKVNGCEKRLCRLRNHRHPEQLSERGGSLIS